MWFRTPHTPRPTQSTNWSRTWWRNFRPRLELLEGRTCPTIALEPAGQFPTGGHYLQGIASADLDGDGDLDLAVGEYMTDNVSILRNDGTGAYAAGVRYAAGDGPSFVTTGDFDLDGDLDLAVANSESRDVTVHANNGDGTFATPQRYDTAGLAFSVSTGDLNGDGSLDLAVVNHIWGSNNLAVFMNDGTGSFGSRTIYAAGGDPRGVAIADYDADGDLDLAVANQASNTVSILFNLGAEAFAGAVNYPAGSPIHIRAADMDVDGDKDLIVANRFSDTVSVLRNSGTGSFTPEQPFPAGDHPIWLTTDDFDLDGDTDVAATNAGSDSVSVYANDGTGNLVLQQTFAVPGTGNAGHIVSTDANGDGYPDLAVGGASGNSADLMYVFRNVTFHDTATTLTASALTPLFGVDGVTLTATVIAPDSGTPTGTVTFYDGATIVGTANLIDGVAALALGSTALAVGPHILRAVYDGDAGFLESEGADIVTVLAPSAIQGMAYVDFDDDGQVDLEDGIGTVIVTLTGTDDRGQPVYRVRQTDAHGVYAFANLRPSGAAGYTLTESQPAGYPDGRDTLGTVNGVVTGSAAVNDVFAGVILASGGSVAENYNFGERPATTGTVGAGQTAGIGFWQNKNGQNLIKALNGGATATQLGHWLAVTFPNIYAALDGMTNAQVGAFYKTLFARNGNTSPGGPPKTDAQVMATALAVYVTNQTLTGTTAAAYGFQVTATGVGTRTFNVGNWGAAFGVANGTSLSVMDLLLAVNGRSRNGVLYDLNGDGVISGSEAGMRTMADDVFGAINEAGGL